MLHRISEHSTVHSAWCNLCTNKMFLCVSISIFSANNGRNNRSAHFVLCYFSVLLLYFLGLLDSCIILLHFTEFTDLYFIRYGFFSLSSILLFFFCFLVGVCVSTCLGCRSFFGVFSVDFYFLLHFTSVFMNCFCFFWVFGFFLSQVTSVLRCENRTREKWRRKNRNAQKRIRLKREAYNFCIEKLLHQKLNRKK